MVDFVWHQARYLKKHYPKFDIHVLAPHDSDAEQCEEWEGVTIHRYQYFWPVSKQSLVYPAIWPNIKENPWRLFQVPFLLLNLYLATKKVVKQHNISLIYSHWFMPQGLICNSVAKQFSIPHVMTSHAADIVIMQKLPFIGEFLVRRILPSLNAISFAGSRGMAQALDFFQGDKRKRLEEKCQVLPMGVDLQLPNSTESSLESDSSTLQLLFVGRLAEKKGVTFLLNAMSLSIASGVLVRLDLLGDGPLMQEIKQEVISLGLSKNVTFHGFVNGEQKFQFIQNSDLFVLPSIVTEDGDAEGLPVSLLEAMSAGAACCASDESGAPDIIEDRKTALMFKAKDADALAKVFSEFSDMADDERSTLRNNARLAGESFLWDNMIHRHCDYLINPFVEKSTNKSGL